MIRFSYPFLEEKRNQRLRGKWKIYKKFQIKGKFLRKSCASIKISEKYLSKNYLIINGLKCTTNKKLRNSFLPSMDCIDCFSNLLEDVANVDNNFPHQLIFLQTILRVLLETSSKYSQRNINTLLFQSSPSLKHIFLNENFSETYSQQRFLLGENTMEFNFRLILDAITYIMNSVTTNLTILVCDDRDPLYLKLKSKNTDIQVLTMEEHLTRNVFKCCQKDRSSLLLDKHRELYSKYHEISPEIPYEILTATSTKPLNLNKNRNIFCAHLSPKDIHIGMKSGKLLKGKFSVYTHNMKDAQVEVKTDKGVNGRSLFILIEGSVNSNRAMEGDIVVVELFPQNKWSKPHYLNYLPQDTEDEEVDDTIDDGNNIIDTSTPIEAALKKHSKAPLFIEDLFSDTLPTGRVVGILRRTVSQIIATVPYYKNNIGPKEIPSNAMDNNQSQSVVLEKETFLLVTPVDQRFPKIRIRTKQWSMLAGQRVVVSVASANDNYSSIWPANSQFPNGYFIRCLGPIGDWKTEVEALLMKHNIPMNPFSPLALACLPSVPSSTSTTATSVNSCSSDSHWEIPEWMLVDRWDVRKSRMVFSVDPPGCQDIDDAASVHWLEPGRIEIAVHIADVCAFLAPGSALDVEAQARGTTVYLTHTRMDMLPSLLSSDIASLHGDRDRLAVTTVWHLSVMHKNGNPVKEEEDILALYEADDIIFEFPKDAVTWAGRSAIRSCAAMTYDQAHNLIAGLAPDLQPSLVPPGTAGLTVPSDLWSALRKSLRLLTALGRFLLAKREKSGALAIKQGKGSELKFKLNEEGLPVAVKGKEELEIHSTVAELMILTNAAVAKLICDVIPRSALLRIHSAATKSKLEDIHELSLNTGLQLSPDNSKLLSELREYQRQFTRQNEEFPLAMISSLVVRAMSEAKYMSAGDLSGGILSSENSEEGGSGNALGHYGLGLIHYTHFTSPIRRYADIIVHRQLLAVIALTATHSSFPVKVLRKTEKSSSFRYIPCVIPEDDDKLQGLNENSNDVTRQVITVHNIGDGRQTFDKIAITSVASSGFPVPEARHHLNTTFNEKNITDQINNYEDNASDEDRVDDGDDDGDDFLDSLLEDVGPDLLSTVNVQEQCSNSNQLISKAICHPDIQNDVVHTPLNVNNINNNNIVNTSNNSNASTRGDVTANVIDSPRNDPYSPSEVSAMASHLNIMNRQSKAVQKECQQLFLSLYFKNKSEIHEALVYTLKSNGFLAYLPDFDYKGSVYLVNTDGSVQLHNSLISSFKSLSHDQNLSLASSTSSSSSTAIVNQSDHNSNEMVMKYNKCSLITTTPTANSNTSDNQDKSQTPSSKLIIHNEHESIDQCHEKTHLILTPWQRVLVQVSGGGGVGMHRIHKIRITLIGVSLADGSWRGTSPPTKKSHQSDQWKVPNSHQELQSVQNSTTTSIDSVKPLLTNHISNFNKNEILPSIYSTIQNICNIYQISDNNNRKINIRKYSTDNEEILNHLSAIQKKKKMATKIESRSKSKQLQGKKSSLDSSFSPTNFERFNCPGTGRVAYGIKQNKFEQDGISELFRQIDTANTSGDAHKLLVDQHATASLTAGHTAAMTRMKALGEEWADEEDLPGSYGVTRETNDSSNSGTSNASELLGKHQKEIQQATQRQYLLKKEKRKNSHYG